MIKLDTKGDFKRTSRFLTSMSHGDIFKKLGYYGQQGVVALSKATPVQTGRTASSWSYKVVDDGKSYSIIWSNSNVVNGVPIAIILQYGHGTGTGGYVAGRDYINPAMRPIFDQIASNVWKEVTNA